jgi:hypothetical protein
MTQQYSPLFNSRAPDDDIAVDATAVVDEDRDGAVGTVGTGRQVGGAAAVGGILGFCFVGPVVALIAAGGAAAVATSHGKAGEVARSTGEVAASAGDRLQQFNQKHRVVEKTSNGIVKGCRWMSHQLKQPSTTTATK